MAMNDLTAARLRELLTYDPETGVFTRRIKIRKRVGAPAGSKNSNGYLSIMVAGHAYKAHRLAWLYVHGVWPDQFIDHINGVRDDNRIVNLRQADYHINAQNVRRKRVDNKTGWLGVQPSTGSKTFTARLTHQGRKIYIGNFKTPELAHQAYLETKRRLHPGCVI